MGECVLPVLLEAAKSAETEDWQRARIFAVARALPGTHKGDFTELAAEHLTGNIVYGYPALSLIESFKSSKHAPAVCDYLLRAVKEDIAEKTVSSRPIFKTFSVIGTRKELERMDEWIADHKERLGKGHAIWKLVSTAADELRAKLSA